MDTTDPHFEDPRLLAVAAVAGLVLFIALRWAEHRRRKGLVGFASATLLGRLLSGFSVARRLTKDIAVATAFALLVACFAGPRWGVEESKQKGATEDVIFALDVSKSMLVADMSPTRLARAKAAIAGFVRRKGTGNVGLIAGLFFGLAFGAAGIGSALLGRLADHTSIATVFAVSAWFPLIGLLTAFLPEVEARRKA